MLIRVRIPVRVTIYRRHLIGRDAPRVILRMTEDRMIKVCESKDNSKISYIYMQLTIRITCILLTMLTLSNISTATSYIGNTNIPTNQI